MNFSTSFVWKILEFFFRHFKFVSAWTFVLIVENNTSDSVVNRNGAFRLVVVPSG